MQVNINKAVINDDFDGENAVDDIEPYPCGTSLLMQGFTGEKLHKMAFIQPAYIKAMLLEYFYLRLYKAKLAGQRICVNIESYIGGAVTSATIDTDEMPDLTDYLQQS